MGVIRPYLSLRLQKTNWDDEKLRGCKSSGIFRNDGYRESQTKKKVQTCPVKSSIEETIVAKIDIGEIHTFTGMSVRYKTAGKISVCVICNKYKLDNRRRRFW